MTENDRSGESRESVYLADEVPNPVPRVRGAVRKAGTVLTRFHREESGASAPEYAFLIGLLSLVSVAVIRNMVAAISDIFSSLSFQ